MKRSVAVAAAMVVLPVVALVTTPTPSSAATKPHTSRLLAAGSTPPIAGERIVIQGHTPPGRRAVRLQRQRPAGWRTVATASTSKAGSFRFAVRPTSDQRLRVAAPASASRGRWTSMAQSIHLARQRVSLASSSQLSQGVATTVHGTLSPTRRGRPIAVEERVGDRWILLGRGTESATGNASVRVVPDRQGVRQLRMVALTYRGAHLARSPVSTVDVREPDAFDPVPRLDIVTDDGQAVTSGEAYSHATMSIDPRGSGLDALGTSTRLRVRGNSTSWIRSKLSYKVKLDSASEVLGMPRSKNWVLLANFYDRSMLRNTVAFEASRRIGLPWTPRMADVEVWLNGKPAGLYQLGEGIEAEASRVDLDTDADADPAEGGFLLEGDSWPDDGPAFTTTHGLRINVKDPGDVDETYTRGVADVVQRFEDALYGADYTDPARGYRAYVDVDSFIDWWLVNELMKNVDASYNNSIWMYADTDARLHMGPVWDFDQSAGNATAWGVDDPTGWLVRRNWYDPAAPTFNPTQMEGPEGHWLNRMFTDPWFVARAEARWREVRDSLSTLPQFVTAHAASIDGAAARNFSTTGAGMPIGPSFMDAPPGHVFQGSWTGEAAALSGWLAARIAWMDQQLDS